MLPLLKILTVIFKVFSKPLINYTKKHHIARNKLQQKPTFSKKFYVAFGNYVNVFETKVNRKFLNISDDIPFKIKPLKEEQALEKGLEYFYEILFYAFLITLPIYEMHKANKDAKTKAAELNQRLDKIETNIRSTKDNFIEESHKVNGKMNELQTKINETDKTLLDVVNYHIEQRNEHNEEIKSAFSNSKTIIGALVAGKEELNKMIGKLNKQQEMIGNLLIEKAKLNEIAPSSENNEKN